MSSNRLPGKVLMPINGIPMLLRMTDRARQAKRIDKLIVATSVEKSDNAIEEICVNNRIEYFRGALDDVLERFYCACLVWPADHIVRLTGDCPLIDPEIIDKTIDHHIEGGYDYTRNYGFPDGLDVEVMSEDALNKCHSNACLVYEREHVTPYLYKNPELFRLGRYEHQPDLSGVKLSVDTMEDVCRVEKVTDLCLNSTWEILRNY